MRLYISHQTDYRFSQPQARLVQLLKMTPSSHYGQTVVDWRIDVDVDARLKNGRDGFGNETAMLYVDGPLDHISLSVTGEVLTDNRAGVVQGSAEPLPPLLFTRSTRLTEPSEAIAAFAREIGGTDPLDRMHRLNDALHARIRFDPGSGSSEGDAATAFESGIGVGQDMAHIFIAAARDLGVPARYVSGHLFRRDEADGCRHEAAHAWAEAHVDDYGWIGFDPANGRCPDDAYVRVATGLDYRDAAPVSGMRIGGGIEAMAVGVRVGLSDTIPQQD
ncbi:MAG: transglutaminase family protein [Sphingomonas sp.]